MPEAAPTTTNAPAAPSGEQTPPPAETKAGETPPKESPKEAAPAPRKHKLTIDGAERELADAEIVDTLLEALGPDGFRNVGQLGQAARRKVAELGKKERDLLEAVGDIKDPKRAFALIERVHGRDVARSLAEEWYARDLEERQLKPDEREERTRKQRIEELRAEEEKLSRSKAERERVAQAEQMQPQFQKMFETALSAAGAEPDPLLIAEMARYVEAEFETVTTREALDLLVIEAAKAAICDTDERATRRFPKLGKDKRAVLLREALKSATPDELAELLGEEGIRGFRKWDVERTKKAGKPEAPAAPPRTAGGQFTERKKIPIDEYFAQLERDREARLSGKR